MPPDAGLRFASWLRRRGYARGLASLLAALRPQGEERILDLDAGTGVIALEVAMHSTGVFAMDPQERRVVYIRETCPTVTAGVGRADKIPFSDY
jgi:predicted RNA methylase